MIGDKAETLFNSVDVKTSRQKDIKSIQHRREAGFTNYKDVEATSSIVFISDPLTGRKNSFYGKISVAEM